MSLRNLLLLLAGLLALPGCFVTRPLGLGPDPAPTEIGKGDTADVIYAKADALYKEKRWKEAGEAFGKVWKDHPESPLAADARYYEAMSRYGMEKWNGAFELFKSYLKAQPLSPYAKDVQRTLYDMGVFILEGGQGKFLGMFDSSGEGLDVLEYLVVQFPNGELADDALLHMADFEWRNRKPQDAATHLHDLLDRYPGSEWAREARLRLAKAYRDMNRGSRYDADALKRSAAQYYAYIDDVSSTPALAREYADQIAVAKQELAEVEALLASKGLEAADFYLYQGKSEAAKCELQNVCRCWPDTPAAAEAKRRLGYEGGK